MAKRNQKKKRKSLKMLRIEDLAFNLSKKFSVQKIFEIKNQKNQRLFKKILKVIPMIQIRHKKILRTNLLKDQIELKIKKISRQ